MFRNNTLRAAVYLTLLSSVALPQTAYAASYASSRPKGVQTTYTASLAEITKSETTLTTRTLDWQQPSIDLYFDLPPAERTSEIVFTLSADPLTTVSRNTPLEVQFNNSKPVPVVSNGNGFEARLPFDAALSRDRHNRIRITYPTPEGSECVAPAHGAWSIDLSASKLKMSGRALRRHMTLREVTEYLDQPSLSPKKVGLIAYGRNSADMQALAAQGISLRTPGVPKFSTSSRGTDFNVVMVKRDRLFDITDDPIILNTSGPQIFVPRGRPRELIFTAETDAGILHLLKIFVTRKLPSSRRPIASLGAVDLQNRLGSETQKISGKSRIMDLAVGSDLGPGAQTYKFGVEDPVASSGELILNLKTMKKIAADSRIRVALNGEILGAAKLDKKRKSVAFPIKAGTLNSTSNILNIVPDLAPQTGYTCPTFETLQPEYSISDHSRIVLTQATPSPVTELSRLTSTGGLFAETESYIALPDRTQDFEASLRVLGRMAKSIGHGLTLADYARGTNFSTDEVNTLIIGPAQMTRAHLSKAPKALKDALSGQPSTGDNLLENDFESYASAGLTDVAVTLAALDTQPRKITRGGIASLYSAGNGNLIGVISNAPGQSFVSASNTLVDLNHWNALQGSVARWTTSSVVMAQIAQPDTGILKPTVEPRFKLPDINLDFLDSRDFSWPHINWPEINWPEFDIENISLPEFKMPSLKTPEIETTPSSQSIENEYVPPSKIAQVTPRLKPAFKSKAPTGLRGPFEFKIETKKPPVNSFNDVVQLSKAKWFDTKQWFKEKTNSLRGAKSIDDIATATDKLQDRVTPSGNTLKSKLKNITLPAQRVINFGDRSFSVYGLILMIAFALVILLMSLAKPKSRLGGRH